MLKRCIDCVNFVDTILFSKNKRRKDGLNQRCKPCDSIRSARRNKEDSEKLRRSEALKRRKRDLVKNLGGVCYCCGESNYLILTVDHINNDGKQENRYSDFLYGYIKRQGYPRDRYRLSCWNCNSGRGHGVCPHEQFDATDPSTWPKILIGSDF